MLELERTNAWMERSQDAVSSLVGMILVLLAAVVLVAGVVSFFEDLTRLSLLGSATDLLDELLLVLILVEIVHTVVLSLRAHELVAEPFVVVGLVAVIRKVLFVLSGQQAVSNARLGIYLGMVAVFVAALLVVRWSDRISPHAGGAPARGPR